jgi:hypothetical protein
MMRDESGDDISHFLPANKPQGEISHYGAAFLKSTQRVENGPVSCGAKGWHTECPKTGKVKPARSV